MPSLPLDVYGYPAHDRAGREAAVKMLMHMVNNELPDGISQLWVTDAEWLIDCVMSAYWEKVRQR